jgi:hypothetical protein
MADLTELQAASVTKLAGANATTGNEDYFVDADGNGNLKVIDYATAATGSAAPSNASMMGGKNPSGNLVSLLTDASSFLYVNVQASALPTGAATAANQATEITSLQLIDNPVGGGAAGAAGSAGTNSFLIGGVFNTALPTLTTGQQAGVQLDSSGRQIIAPLVNTSVVKAQLQDNAGNGLTSTLINSKQRLDVDVTFSGADNATAPFYTGQIGGQDSTGKLQAAKSAVSGELFVKDIIDVSSQYQAVSCTTTSQEAKGAATHLTARKMILITPTDGTIYWGTTSTVTITTGTPIFKNQTIALAFSENVPVWIISASAVNVRILEAS